MIKEKIITLLKSTKREGIEGLINFLNKSDYFIAPSSTTHHCNYEGGLVEHSLNVYELLKEKNARYKLGISKDTVIITGLLHDLCKVNLYKKVDNNDGTFKYIWDDKFPCGHGEKSIIIAQRYIKLTDEECMMIRYHMGLTENGVEKSFYTAIGNNKNVLALHFADWEASRFLE